MSIYKKYLPVLMFELRYSVYYYIIFCSRKIEDIIYANVLLLLVDLYIPLPDNIEMCETGNFRFQRHSKL